MTKLKKAVLYIVSFVVGLLIMLFVLAVKSFSFSWPVLRIYRIFCDASFASAVVLIGFGLLLAISNEGLFVSVSYSWYRFSSTFGKDYESKRKNMLSYKEYRDMKLEKRAPSAFAWIPGLVYLGISIVFLILFLTY